VLQVNLYCHTDTGSHGLSNLSASVSHSKTMTNQLKVSMCPQPAIRHVKAAHSKTDCLQLLVLQWNYDDRISNKPTFSCTMNWRLHKNTI